MKKKFLVPIMALAIAVIAGVNYKMISSTLNKTNLSLCSLTKVYSANAEEVEPAPGGERDSTSLQLYETKDADGNVTDVDCPSSGVGC